MKLWISLILFVLATTLAQAQDALITSYTARLSSQDHFSSTGVRLTTAAAIIRQDRANFHKFGKPDDEDEVDQFFGSAGAREALERMLERGSNSRAAINAIVNGTPLVKVSVWRSERGYEYVRVVVAD